MPHQYYPGADRREIFRVFEFAAEKAVPIYTHVRSMGAEAMQEVLADAAATGATLHIVHVNSSSLWELPLVLELIEGARKRGVDVSTEAYPYTAASTSIESAIFDEGWQERLRISYGDIQWQDTGERLTEETFKKYRQQGGIVIIHLMKPEWIDLAVRTPFVMIASDGMPYAPGAHPRSAGTFSRVLGRYVREREILDLMEAVAKMTLLPAKRLEGVAPSMKKKGRIQVGADADITVFDLGTIVDTATFEDELSFSKGVVNVLVGGTFVVRDSQSVKDVFPGKPVLGRYRAGS
jgi:dihydroorotase